MASYDLSYDPYAVLGVPQNAKLPEIRSAFRKLAVKYHPDKIKDRVDRETQQATFMKICAAYEVLSDERSRALYDAQSRRNVYMSEPARPRSEGPQRRKQLAPGRLVVHGRLNKTQTHAIPDTGAEYNIIAKPFVTELGLKIVRHKERLRLANGNYTQTCGVVEAEWRFGHHLASNTVDGITRASETAQAEKEKVWRLVFHVLDDFIYDLALGHSFIMETETMSRFNHRLARIPRALDALSVLRVNLLGSPTQRLKGNLEDVSVSALPDTGSEPNLLSWDFLESLDWAIPKLNRRNRRLLQFADGSVQKTEGSIIANWTFSPWQGDDPKSTISEGLAVEFHVYRGCPYDLIMGQDALEETDAFVKHQDSFGHIQSESNAAVLNLVIFKRKKQSISERDVEAGIRPSTNSSQLLHDELQRRAADDRARRRAQHGQTDSAGKSSHRIQTTTRKQQENSPRSRHDPVDPLYYHPSRRDPSPQFLRGSASTSPPDIPHRGSSNPIPVANVVSR